MNECNCWIGILNDDDQSEENNMYLDNYIDKLKTNSKNVKVFIPIFGEKYNIKPEDYIDKRKCMSTMFNYCPICGIKVEWRKLRKALKGEA